MCDKRRPLSESKAAFPAVDFSLIEHEDDIMWETQHVESESSVVVRGAKFLQVSQRMSHPGWGFTHAGQLETGRRWTAEVDMREVVTTPGRQSNGNH